uniref:ROK family protein n=1 Tax=uncultured Christiangramia sp. TaxID=503836 RepID=UPI002621007E|nr:ROK family protein [uncultured Christiangramia sp.]
MNLYNDKRIVMTLDAGGTNFVFSALQCGKEIITPIILPSNSSDLEKCLKTIISGFKEVQNELLPEFPVAISFAFPGPADYENGIIGDLPNFKSFKGGVALGPMLENVFNLPTFINNDGDLFTYGEAMAGFLPEINKNLKNSGIQKEYRNLFGITLGTGFGGGMVINGKIYKGDNSASSEIWLMRNFKEPNLIAEEGVSIRAVKRCYCEKVENSNHLSPEDIFLIAKGLKEGNQEAALQAYERMAVIIGESLANALTLFDGPVVIGGGISGASDILLPKIIEHLNGTIETRTRERIPRLVSKVFNIENKSEYCTFLDQKFQNIQIPFTQKSVNINTEKRIPIGLSKLGTSEAVCLGAYAFALISLKNHKLA